MQLSTMYWYTYIQLSYRLLFVYIQEYINFMQIIKIIQPLNEKKYGADGVMQTSM